MGGGGVISLHLSTVLMFFLLLVYLGLIDDQMEIPQANAAFHGKNVAKFFENNSTHSEPFTFKEYVLQNDIEEQIPLTIASKTYDKAEKKDCNELGVIEMYDQKEYANQQEEVAALIGKKLRCKREIPINGCGPFIRCKEIFPINTHNNNKEVIGPFPVPWFPFHGKCSATNPVSLPPSKLIINPLLATNGNISCHTGVFICYASAFEGEMKMDLWEILKLENIRENEVAIMCNKNDNSGLKWHGFRIQRRYKIKNISETIDNLRVFQRLTISDSMEFSYSKRRINLKEGEFFHQLILTPKGIEVFTSRRNIYKRENANDYYDPEKEINIRKRSDLMNVDLSSIQRIYYEFNYNASLWTIPYDIAIINPSKYNVSFDGIPDGKNLKILAMKVISSEECFINQNIDIDCILEWKKVAPVAFNYTLVNGTNVMAYYMKYGYLKYSPTIFKKDKWVNVRDEIYKFKDFYNYLKKEEFDDSTIDDPKIGEIKSAQITKEEYDNGLMTIKMTCFHGEIAYGWVKFNPNMATDTIESAFSWSKDFDFLNGCKHSLINLSSKLIYELRFQSLRFPGPIHKVQFFVGLEAKNSIRNFILTKERIIAFKKFHRLVQEEEFFGQKISADENVSHWFKSYNLTAKFIDFYFDPKLIKSITGITDDSWSRLIGEYAVFQEIYDCPAFRVFLPQLSGNIKFTFTDKSGNRITNFIGYNSKNLKVNFIDFFTIETISTGQVKCKFMNVYKTEEKDISRNIEGGGQCIL